MYIVARSSAKVKKCLINNEKTVYDIYIGLRRRPPAARESCAW